MEKKILGMALMAVATLLGGCASQEHKHYQATQNPDGTPYTAAQVLEIETIRAIERSGFWEGNAERGDKYGSLYQKKYIAAFNQSITDNELPTMRMAGNSVGIMDTANIAMHVFNAPFTLGPLWMVLIPSGDAGKSSIKHSYKTISKPHFSLYHIAEQGSKLEDEFAFMERVFLTIADCTPFAKISGWETGTYAEGHHHERRYVCDPSQEGTPAENTFGTLLTMFTTQESAFSEMLPQGTLYSRIHYTFSRHTENEAINYYNKVKDAIPENAYAVFTGPNEQGEWRVFVAQNGKVVAFPLPDTKGKSKDLASKAH
ncbi:MAG: hypothetical protein C0631_07580 [Sedimenticola sp.]|nr:MAG: hypothetical protein C0631_07580 [Sedimenticola sp.]